MFTLPKLPYAEDALAPHISAQTMALHYGKHHKGYVDTLNKLLTGDPLADLPLALVVHQTHGIVSRKAVFNNAAQSWNHEFFWKSMKPGGGGAPEGPIMEQIGRDIGGAAAFHEAFNKAAAAHFSSGWIWLTLSHGKIEVVTTHDADLPPVHGRTVLLCCDLWEHAYYLDYNNRRAAFVETSLDQLLNWDFANANLAAVKEAVA